MDILQCLFRHHALGNIADGNPAYRNTASILRSTTVLRLTDDYVTA